MVPNINNACLADSSEAEDSIASLMIIERIFLLGHFTKNANLVFMLDAAPSLHIKFPTI
jgi:hypothetical protein